MTTDFAALDAVYPLAPEELFRQWVLRPEASATPPGWTASRLRGWTLTAHPEAHVCALHAEDGDLVGWAMKPLLHVSPTRTERPGSALTLQVPTARFSGAEIERALYGRDADGWTDGTGLQGMWVALVFSAAARSFARVYLAPAHSVVYDPRRRAVATSPGLIGPQERALALSRAFDPLESQRFFSFGLTAFRGTHRLLPNHYLDLDRFEAVRHWPKRPFPRFDAGASGAAAMVEDGRRILGGFAASVDRFRVSLSAGNDSRAVLALLRPFVEAGRPPVELSTSIGVDFSRRIDLQGARRLAGTAGLDLNVQKRGSHDRAPPHLVMRNFARIGETTSGPSLSNPGTLGQAGPVANDTGLALAGMAGELGRAFYWHDDLPEKVTAQDLLGRVDAPVMPATLAAAGSWLDGLPAFLREDPADVLDLAYLEQRLGCWEASMRYLYPGAAHSISPMTSAFSLQTMLRLPRSYRRAGVLQRDMVAHGWPALLAVPINRATGALWVEQKARGVLRRIRRIGGLVRQ